jgi:DnaJ-class molecular chaperone
MAKRDYYELLGVSRDASDADIEDGFLESLKKLFGG